MNILFALKNRHAFPAVLIVTFFVVVALLTWVALTYDVRNHETLTTIGAIIGATGAFYAWVVSQWREYDRRCFEMFFKMREEFRKNKNFSKIFQALDGDIKKVTLSRITDVQPRNLHRFLRKWLSLFNPALCRRN